LAGPGEVVPARDRIPTRVDAAEQDAQPRADHVRDRPPIGGGDLDPARLPRRSYVSARRGTWFARHTAWYKMGVDAPPRRRGRVGCRTEADPCPPRRRPPSLGALTQPR